MINLLHKQNGEIYDRFLSGELTLKKARDEFLALSRLLVRSRVKPVVIGVLEEIGKAWAELAEREYIAEQKAKAKAEREKANEAIKKRLDFDKTTPESLFLYK